MSTNINSERRKIWFQNISLLANLMSQNIILICITTTDDEVILTKNRLFHLAKKHPEILRYIKKIEKVLANPDAVYIEKTKVDTIWLVKKFKNNIKITIKLNTIELGKENYKNSIIQMQFLDVKRLDKYIKNNRIMKVFEKEKVM